MNELQPIKRKTQFHLLAWFLFQTVWMLKKITPVILALLFLGQIFLSAASAAPAVHYSKETKLLQASGKQSPVYFDIAIEDELDEDDFHDIQSFQIAQFTRSEIRIPLVLFKTESTAHQIFSRINSTHRAFTCVFII